jgi:hypothetical protein
MIFDVFDVPQRKYAVGAAFLRGQGNGRVRAVHGWNAVQSELGDIIVDVKLPQPGATPSPSYEGDGFVIVRHPETRVVEDAVARVVSLIRVELA